jgi:hypothetical protein
VESASAKADSSSPPGSGKAPSGTPAAAPAALCPRCKTKLIDAAGLGWCAECGYCQSLEDDKDKIRKPEAAKTTNLTGGAGDVFRLIVNLPSWVWLLLMGIGIIGGLSFSIGRQFAPDSFQRAAWCTSQIGAGLLLMLAAQFWALTYLAPEDEKLGVKDVLLPTRLWPLMFRHMPAMRWPVSVVSWGLALSLCAVIFIGGLSHWMNYLPGSKTAQSTGKKK